MRYIERDGTRHAWPEWKVVPPGWAVVEGKVPGPPETPDQLDALRDDLTTLSDQLEALTQRVARVEETYSG